MEDKKLLGDNELQQVAGGTGNGSAGYVWPVPGFHVITAYFYDPSSSVMNGGIDISGAGISGAAVVAAADGTVNPTYFCDGGWGGGYGTFCMIDHPEGKSTLYAHLSSVCVSPGQVVHCGQVIGFVGETGDVSGPCLHFETRKMGVKYDPMSEF